MHAAENDDVGVGLGGGLRELQRIGHGVGDFLHFGALVVMRQQNGVAFRAELADALLLCGGSLRRVLDRFNGRAPRSALRKFCCRTSISAMVFSCCGRIEL